MKWYLMFRFVFPYSQCLLCVFGEIAYLHPLPISQLDRLFVGLQKSFIYSGY